MVNESNKIKDTNGDYWIYREEKLFFPEDFKYPRVVVIQACNMSEKFKKQLREGNHTEFKKSGIFPSERNVAAMCEAHYVYSGLFNTRRGKFGLVCHFENSEFSQKKLEILPIYDSWSCDVVEVYYYITRYQDQHTRMIHFWNKTDKENTLISFDLEFKIRADGEIIVPKKKKVSDFIKKICTHQK